MTEKEAQDLVLKLSRRGDTTVFRNMLDFARACGVVFTPSPTPWEVFKKEFTGDGTHYGFDEYNHGNIIHDIKQALNKHGLEITRKNGA